MTGKIIIIKLCTDCPHFSNNYNYCYKHGVQLAQGFSSSAQKEWEKNIAMDGNFPKFCTLSNSGDENVK